LGLVSFFCINDSFDFNFLPNLKSLSGIRCVCVCVCERERVCVCVFVAVARTQLKNVASSNVTRYLSFEPVEMTGGP
jgi:hypothetical protein